MRVIKPSFYIPTFDPRLQIGYDSHSRACGLLIRIGNVNVPPSKNNRSTGQADKGEAQYEYTSE